MNLTDEEIRIKVAEECGYANIRQERYVLDWGGPMKQVLMGDRNTFVDCSPEAPELSGWMVLACRIPNYPESRDACAEFEATLTREERNRYVNLLDDMALESMDDDDPVERDFRWCCSSAKHRCLAYLKTKGPLP